jgi:hypothetical protein
MSRCKALGNDLWRYVCDAVTNLQVCVFITAVPNTKLCAGPPWDTIPGGFVSAGYHHRLARCPRGCDDRKGCEAGGLAVDFTTLHG